VRLGGRWGPLQRLKNAGWLLAARAALAVADRLPVRWLLAAGRALGRLGALVLRGPRARAAEQARLALGVDDPRRFARDCFVRAGENLAWSLLLRRRGLRALDLVEVDADARRTLGSALGEGRGVVFVSAHLGPFELIAAAVAELGLSPAVVVRESYDPRLDPLVDRHRLERGVEVIHRGRPGAVRRIVRALDAGRPVGFLPDLGGRVQSVPVALLGQPVQLPVGPARIALGRRCPVLIGTLSRAPSRAVGMGAAAAPFRLRVERLAGEPCEARMTQRVADALGEAIRRAPAEWLWMAPRFGGG
jgi:KDO2-lipid IV(A) lauroyltransferase